MFVGTIGAGAYFTPHFRGDLTLDFLTSQDIDASATYLDPGPINGSVTDRVRVNRVVGLVNLYWDVLPRGMITPYIGAGVGFVYNDLNRTHLTTDDTSGHPQDRVQQGNERRPRRGPDGRCVILPEPPVGARRELPRSLPGGRLRDDHPQQHRRSAR